MSVLGVNGLLKPNARMLSMNYFMETMRSLGFMVNPIKNRDDTFSVLFSRDELFLKIDLDNGFSSCKCVISMPGKNGRDVEFPHKMVMVDRLGPELLPEIQKHLLEIVTQSG